MEITMTPEYKKPSTLFAAFAVIAAVGGGVYFLPNTPLDGSAILSQATLTAPASAQDATAPNLSSTRAATDQTAIAGIPQVPADGQQAAVPNGQLAAAGSDGSAPIAGAPVGGAPIAIQTSAQAQPGYGKRFVAIVRNICR
jgi:hypothetical protein